MFAGVSRGAKHRREAGRFTTVRISKQLRRPTTHTGLEGALATGTSRRMRKRYECLMVYVPLEQRRSVAKRRRRGARAPNVPTRQLSYVRQGTIQSGAAHGGGNNTELDGGSRAIEYTAAMKSTGKATAAPLVRGLLTDGSGDSPFRLRCLSDSVTCGLLRKVAHS